MYDDPAAFAEAFPPFPRGDEDSDFFGEDEEDSPTALASGLVRRARRFRGALGQHSHDKEKCREIIWHMDDEVLNLVLERPLWGQKENLAEWCLRRGSVNPFLAVFEAAPRFTGLRPTMLRDVVNWQRDDYGDRASAANSVAMMGAPVPIGCAFVSWVQGPSSHRIGT